MIGPMGRVIRMLLVVTPGRARLEVEAGGFGAGAACRGTDSPAGGLYVIEGTLGLCGATLLVVRLGADICGQPRGIVRPGRRSRTDPAESERPRIVPLGARLVPVGSGLRLGAALTDDRPAAGLPGRGTALEVLGAGGRLPAELDGGLTTRVGVGVVAIGFTGRALGAGLLSGRAARLVVICLTAGFGPALAGAAAVGPFRAGAAGFGGGDGLFAGADCFGAEDRAGFAGASFCEVPTAARLRPIRPLLQMKGAEQGASNAFAVG